MTPTSARAPEHDPAPAAPPAGAAPVPTVLLDCVHRRFGDTPALAGLSLAVPQRSITVLLGPNGAGKTTCTRVVTGALAPDAGEVRVFGLDPVEHGAEIRRRVGIVSAKPALYDRLSGLDNLRYAAELYGLGRREPAARAIADAAERFGISGALDQQVGGYSTGMKTRLALARSVLHGPELVLYDEPTSGLDPESSQAVLRLIREMTDEGNTVIMCTHLLVEAEGLADQVVMLQDGHALVQGRPDDLVSTYWPDATVVFDAEDRAGLARLRDLPGVREVRGDGPVVAVVDDTGRVPDLVQALAAAGVRLTRVEAERHSLEDLYFAVRRSSGHNRIGEVLDGATGGTTPPAVAHEEVRA